MTRADAHGRAGKYSLNFWPAGLRRWIDQRVIAGPTRGVIKLDMALTRSVDTNPARRALVAAMVVFARETGSIVVAEGIETSAEWGTLRALGIRGGQGFFLGRPADLRSAQELLGGELPEPVPMA